jgi:hypothetical protein
MERKDDQKGTHRLKGDETTIADVLTMITLFRWHMPAKGMDVFGWIAAVTMLWTEII